MVEVNVRSREVNGVALVECRLRNEGTAAKRVLVESRLDGPTWPPREGDVSDPRWDGEQAEFVVGAGRTVGVGFAAPAPAREPLVEVVEAEPVRADRTGDDFEPSGGRAGASRAEFAPSGGATAPVETTAASVAGELTDARPPLQGVLEGDPTGAPCDDGVPDVGGAAVSGEDGGGAASQGGSDAGDRRSSRTSEGDRNPSPGEEVGRDRSTWSRTEPGRSAPPATGVGRSDPPGDWLDAVERRTERLEALAAARSLPAATEAVAAVGELGGVRDGVATARADRDVLLAVAARARTLAGRIEAADVPVETLEQLS